MDPLQQKATTSSASATRSAGRRVAAALSMLQTGAAFLTALPGAKLKASRTRFRGPKMGGAAVTAGLPPSLSIRGLQGHDTVMRTHPALAELAERSGQPDSVHDLPYFLRKPGLMRRTPHLVLMEAAAEAEAGANGSRLCGAMIVHEFRPFGYATGAFAVSDRSGRGVLLGSPQERLQLALHAGYHLIRNGGNIVLLTLPCESAPDVAAAIMRAKPALPAEWAIRGRSYPSYLPLQPTMDRTLASLGQKTRSNLRYYRRRAEQELGCTFLPDASITLRELAAFNRESMFPQQKGVLEWRLDVQRQLQDPYLAGLRDRDGRWLSLVCGRRFNGYTEILWQMNRGGLERHSLVSAMRNYLIEHEIGLGASRLYIEGGTPHSIRNSFVTEPVTDLVLVRKRLKPGLARFTERYVPKDNILAEVLTDPDIQWNAC